MGPAHAQSLPPVPDDPDLRVLVEEAMTNSPEVAAARLRVQAQGQRVPVAGALPDPVLSLGYQNDGFDSLAYGEMETTWITVMASQTLPWAGKRDVRTTLAHEEGDALAAQAFRAELTLTADVERTWLEVALTHERLALLEQQAALWARAEEVARVRYAAGGDTQTDLLRIQLERHRLEQRRAGISADLRVAEATLSRLCGRSLDSALPAPPSLSNLPVPPPDAAEVWQRDAVERSPELALARAALRIAEERTALLDLERRPDVTVSAGLMPRGALEPMWQIGVSAPLPVYARKKQAPALSSARTEQAAARADLDNLERLVVLRALERAERQAALHTSLSLYEGGLLDLSAATVQSALAQYAAGRGSFAPVLDALRGTLSDQEQYLEDRSALWMILIAQQEVSLATSGARSAPMGTAAIPSGGTGSTPRISTSDSGGAEGPGAAGAPMGM